MILETALSIYASTPAARAAVRLQGFTHAEKEQIRQVLSQIPDRYLKYTKVIKADPSLGAKHGRYMDIKSGVVHLNPRDFHNRVRFGRGTSHKLPHVCLTVAHEVGHGAFLSLPMKLRDQWRQISGWKEGTGPDQAPPYKEKRPGWPRDTSDETHRKGATFTRRYASRNSDEDFADSFGFYVMGQKDRVPPEKRAFLEKIFV